MKSLVQVPTVLAMMADQLDWTQKLGDAMLAQQADVMDAIQRLRGRAQANGKLQVHQGADGHGQDRGRQAIHRDRADLARPKSTFRTTSPPWSTGIGLILTMRRITFRLPPATSPAARSPPASRSRPPSPFAMPSGATATGVAATSTSSNRNVNINNFDRSNINNFNDGSTTWTIATASNTTTPTCGRNSPRPTSRPARRRGRTFAARTARRCSIQSRPPRRG